MNLRFVDLYETFSVYCHKAAFESGEYFVRVFELGKRGEKTGDEYLFFVQDSEQWLMKNNMIE